MSAICLLISLRQQQQNIVFKMRVFIGEIFENNAFLTEEESKHAHKVLRLQLNDYVNVINGKGLVASGRIIQLGKKIEIEIQRIEAVQQPKCQLHMALAPTKNIDRFEFFIEKAVEFGVTEITPIITQHSERKILNIEKIRKQIQTACKQSLQYCFPVCNDVVSWNDFLQLHSNKTIFLAHCNTDFERISLKDIKIEDEMIFAIGPEGDFSSSEIEKTLNQENRQSISLGNNRLRTETAGIFIASAVYYNGLE